MRCLPPTLVIALALFGPATHASDPATIAAAALDTVAIASPDEALTFARLDAPGGGRVLAVTRYEGGRVTAVDLGTVLARPASDPITLLAEVGYDGVRDAVVAAPDAARVVVPATALALPVDLGRHHIAAGTNYPEHGDEAQVEDGPFLFAKLVEPTGPTAAVPVGDAVLDYEVELAWVILAPLAPGERPAMAGVVLCNDYTDRATLLRHVDPWDPASGTGFTTGKSFDGYLPIGNLFVVPLNVRRFGAGLELRLYVNGRLRQRSRVDAQIWDLDAMLAETWARRERTWEHRGAAVSLLPADGRIAMRTLLMSGTPAGTVFAGVDLGTRARGALGWLTGGWSVSLTSSVVETYIEEARAAGRYLRPGDRVTIRVDRLGVIDNTIVP
jgi:2-keto-4-pentenoate hydratase/2-oxohepta-3-ene-1,7-dioic acid hydratase in catechol pathway